MTCKKIIGISLSYLESDIQQNILRAEYLRLFEIFDAIPILIPNDADIIDRYLEFIRFSGFILSGGNESVIEPSIKSKRNYSEFKITNYAIESGIPILGICRGMQFLNRYFGGDLIENLKCKNFLPHINCTHSVKSQSEKVSTLLGTPEISVNSFHNDGILVTGLAKQLSPLFISADNLVEAFVHNRHQILGIQWHPERVNPINDIQIKILKYFFDNGKDQSYYSRCW